MLKHHIEEAAAKAERQVQAVARQAVGQGYTADNFAAVAYSLERLSISEGIPLSNEDIKDYYQEGIRRALEPSNSRRLVYTLYFEGLPLKAILSRLARLSVFDAIRVKDQGGHYRLQLPDDYNLAADSGQLYKLEQVELMADIRVMLQGRQRDIIELRLSGRSYKDIAAYLKMSRRQVDYRVKQIKEKLVEYTS